MADENKVSLLQQIQIRCDMLSKAGLSLHYDDILNIYIWKVEYHYDNQTVICDLKSIDIMRLNDLEFNALIDEYTDAKEEYDEYKRRN